MPPNEHGYPQEVKISLDLPNFPDDTTHSLVGLLRKMADEIEEHQAVGYELKTEGEALVFLEVTMELALTGDKIQILDTRVADLQELPTVIKNALTCGHPRIFTIRQLVTIPERRLEYRRNIGKVRMKIIKEVLSKHGLHLGMKL